MYDIRQEIIVEICRWKELKRRHEIKMIISINDETIKLNFKNLEVCSVNLILNITKSNNFKVITF